mgnify:CR=1 FL=1
MKEPIHISGIGFSSPLGHTWEEHRENFVQKSPLITGIPYYDTSGSAVPFGGIVRDLDLSLLPKRKLTKLLSHKDRLGVLSACAASREAKLADSPIAGHRIGCYVNTSSSQFADIFPYFDSVLDCVSADQTHFDSHKFGPLAASRVNPLAATKVLLNGALAHICQIFQITGPNQSTMDLELGTVAIWQEACRALQAEEVDAALVVAIAAPFDPIQLSDKSFAKRLRQWDSGTTLADAKAQLTHGNQFQWGLIPAEGAVTLVLEREDSLKKRRITSLGQVGTPCLDWGLNWTQHEQHEQLKSLLAAEPLTTLVVAGPEADPTASQRPALSSLGTCGYMFEAHPLWQLAMGISLWHSDSVAHDWFAGQKIPSPLSAIERITASVSSPIGVGLLPIEKPTQQPEI